MVAAPVARAFAECRVERDMAGTVWTECSNGYRAVEHHDRLGGGSTGSDSRGRR
jgi:hypothetical protein